MIQDQFYSYNTRFMIKKLNLTNLSTDKTAESKGSELTSVDSISTKMTNVELHWSMVLWCNQPISSRTAIIIIQYKTRRIGLGMP